jgi:DNA-binding MarR family transcriptional regulator
MGAKGGARADGEDLAYGILRSIRRILRRVSDHSRDLSRAAGLTVPQLLCLRAVADGTKPVTATEVCRNLGLSAPTVSRILDRLERAGHLRRSRDRSDRRRAILAPTAAGRAALRRSPTPLQEEFLARLRALPRRERGRLLAALEEIVSLMEASDIDAAPLIAPGDQPRRR